MWNSTVVAVSVTFLTLCFCSLSGYTIARQRLRWTVWLLQADVVARFVLAIVLMIPRELEDAARIDGCSRIWSLIRPWGCKSALQ